MAVRSGVQREDRREGHAAQGQHAELPYAQPDRQYVLDISLYKNDKDGGQPLNHFTHPCLALSCQTSLGSLL